MVYRRLAAVFVCICLFSSAAFGQIGGYGVYKFVNLPTSSRVAGLGGSLICVKDDDPTLAIQNPSLLNSSMNNKLSLSFIDYFAGSNFGSLQYVHHFDSVGTAMAGMQYINYGTFTRADENGNILGTFNASEYNFFLGFGRQLNKYFSYGGQLKLIYSSLDIYKSYGAAGDLGMTYYNADKGFTAAIVASNIGYQFQPYYGQQHEPLPFNLQLGASIKPKHMPFRFSMIIHDLERLDISYVNNNLPSQIDLATGTPIQQKVSLSDKIFRHFTFGTEIIVSKGFSLQLGYNDQRRREMTIPTMRGLVGYSGGVSIKINKFRISYGKAWYNLAGSSNTFTLTASMGELLHKGRTVGK